MIGNSPAHIELLLEAIGDAVFRIDLEGVILYASKRATELVGHDFTQTGLHISSLLPAEDRQQLTRAMLATIETGETSKCRVRVHRPQGLSWMEMQSVRFPFESEHQQILVVAHDISAQQAGEERLRHMATHDGLTGLPNRSLLSDRIRMSIAQSRRVNGGFTVLALDLDGFKKVNDALGHLTGDALLRIAANRLSGALRDVDTLARVGGDEFVAVLPGVVNENEIQTVARRMINAMQKPFEIDGHVLYVGTSIGAAIFPQHGDREVKLLAHADTAMYRAKETGKARCVIYSHEKFTQPEHDVSLEAAMFQAVRDGEFLLHYQPIVDARTRQIVGFEALMRWVRPGDGLVSPASFIPMAESNGLINLLGAWALKAACVQIKRFEEVAGRPLYVSVNVSPRQFRNDHFIHIVDEAIKLSGLRGEQLLLEITEGILMADPEYAETLLHAMVKRDIRIAIDDFGTGYSSLAYLKRFPIAALKIDRAFIKDLPASVKDVAICNVVLSLASHLNLSTVAEGVENEAQFDFLSSHGCGSIQGYLTGRPLPPNEIIQSLESDKASASSISAAG